MYLDKFARLKAETNDEFVLNFYAYDVFTLDDGFDILLIKGDGNFLVWLLKLKFGVFILSLLFGYLLGFLL